MEEINIENASELPFLHKFSNIQQQQQLDKSNNSMNVAFSVPINKA